MNFSDLLKLSTRMFKARTSRTFLTILGMGVGISAILFLVSLGYGLQKTLLEKITTADSLLTLDITGSKSENGALTNDTISKIEKINGVSQVSPVAQISSQAHLNDLSGDITVYGIDSIYLRLAGIKILNGREPGDNNPEEIVIGSSVAKIFGKSDDEIIGKEMTFTFNIPAGEETEENSTAATQKVESDKKYKIVGIVSGGDEDTLIYINSSSFTFAINNFNQLKVKCQSDKIMSYVRQEILNFGLSVSSLSDTIDQANKIFRIIQIVLMLFGIIALIVSAIGMFNTMTIALLERTSEIGIMKSIGASDGSVSTMFIMESAIMGFLGGLCGILIGFLEGFIFNGVVNLIALRMGGQKVDLFYSPLWFILTIIIFATVVGILTGIVPARRASRIDPLEALRYK